MSQIIELHCTTTGPQPDVLIVDIIKDTGLELRDAEPRTYGPWTWDYNDVDEAIWVKALPMLSSRIRALYKKGTIRYGGW